MNNYRRGCNVSARQCNCAQQHVMPSKRSWIMANMLMVCFILRSAVVISASSAGIVGATGAASAASTLPTACKSNSSADPACNGDDHMGKKSSLWLEQEMDTIQWPFRLGDPQSSLLDAVQSFFAQPKRQPSDDDDESLLNSIHQQTALIQPTLVSIRRLLHRYPELMYQERITSQIVQRILKEMGVSYSAGWGKNIYSTHYNPNDDDDNGSGENEQKSEDESQDYYDGGGFGIVADIGTGQPPCILLRADMDALPIVERTPIPPDMANDESTTHANHFHSHHHGKMHACGHDAHMTMLLGATLLFQSLATTNDNYPFPGTIRIIFQPAEEGGAGAKRMAQEGVLTRYPPPTYAFAMHVWPTLPSGQIGFRSGPMLGAADMFTFTIQGVGGHAAFPQLVKDPIVASAAIVMNLQTLVSRGMNPLESGVVSVTNLESGDGAFNVIPSTAILRGTIRALSDEAMLALREGLVHIASKTAEVHGCTLASFEFSRDHYPVTMNDDGLYPFASEVAGMVAEGGKVTSVDPTMGAEDFAFLAQGVPSAFFFLGQGGKNGDSPTDSNIGCSGGCEKRVPTNLGLHHPEFNLDEDVLGRGVELFVNLALRSLKDLSQRSQTD